MVCRARAAIRERDGDAAELCWFCGKTMIGHDHTGAPTIDGRDDVTIEHLLARHLALEMGLLPKDYNHLDNLVLAHAKCNRDAGHIPITAKIIYRDILHDGMKTEIEWWIPLPEKTDAPAP